MAKAKKAKATKTKAPKKAPKKRAKKLGTDHHLGKAHGHVMRVVDSVTIADRPHIERIRRALDHAHDNTKHNKPAP